ncbi:MAG TPA: nucleoside-diphosphate kinase [candidate division Zixibacteria bacterium]
MPSKTLLFIKPDAVKRNLIGEIIKRIENAGFKVTALEMKKLSSKRTKEFYKIHKDKPFFNQLVKSIANKPIVGMILEKKSAVMSLREFIGTTNPKKAKKGSIRADFGLDVTRNSVHASDSPKNAKIETKIFFKK